MKIYLRQPTILFVIASGAGPQVTAGQPIQFFAGLLWIGSLRSQ
jgi:hypothetical protein